MSVICGVGAVTPVGRTAWSSAAAVRAGLTGFSRHPFMTDVEARPLQVAAYPWQVDDFAITARVGRAVVEAIRQAIQPIVQAVAGGEFPKLLLLVNLSQSRPGVPDSFVQTVQRTIESAFPRTFNGIAVAQRGHAGGLLAVRSAITALEAHKAAGCIVAGADSYLDIETLEWLEETEQLHGAGRRNNAWGFIPGEGAGAVLLMRSDAASGLGVNALAEVVSVAADAETCLIRTETVGLGVGLTGAFRQVFASLPPGRQISDTYCDMNGEPYRADEYGFAVTRTREWFSSPSDFIAAADCWGDVGAASGPLSMILAAIAIDKCYARGEAALVWGSSDSGERGAAIIKGFR